MKRKPLSPAADLPPAIKDTLHPPPFVPPPAHSPPPSGASPSAHSLPRAFLQRAQLLGHDPQRLKSGEVVSGPVYVNSLADFKGLFTAHMPQQFRTQHSLHARSKRSDPRLSDTEHLMHRLSDHVFGNAPLSHEDAAHIADTLPITVHAMSALDHVVDTDEVYGPSAAPVFLNFGTLTFKEGLSPP